MTKLPLDLTQPTWQLMGRLAGPVFVEQLLILMVGLVDTWLTGHFLTGHDPMAAIGLMAYLLWMISSLFGVVSIAATALVARHVGSGDLPMASRCANQALTVGAGLAVLLTLIMLWIGPYLAGWLHLQDKAAQLATDYLSIVIPALPLVMVQRVGVAALRGAGDALAGFWIMASVNVVNACVSTALVVGWHPFPHLGWHGLAWGTAAGYVVGGLIVIALLARGRSGMRLTSTELWPNLDLARRILRVGIPGGLDRLMIVACHLWFVAIVNSLGALPAAAHSLAIRIESLAYIPGTAFEVAAATLAGQFLGRREPDRASRSVLLCVAAMMALVALIAFLFRWCPDALVGWFTSSENHETATAAIPLLKLVAYGLPFLGISMVLTGALRGAGDTRVPLVISVIGFLCFRIPLAYWFALETISFAPLALTLPGWNGGVVGAWYAMLCDVVVRAALVAWRFVHGGWREVKV